MYKVDINSILNSYRSSRVYTNHGIMKFNPEDNVKNDGISLGVDSYEASSNGTYMRSECYDYGMSKLNVTKAAQENQQSEPPAAPEDGQGEDSGEAKTETEVKVINGQAYMIITTTDEDGTVTVKRIKLGANVGKQNNKVIDEDKSLADAVTM